MPYKVNQSRRHKIPKARYRVQNWSTYDAALRRRGDLTIWVTPWALAVWTPPHAGRRGRPQRYSDIAIEAGLMLRLAFGRPWRQTEGLLGSLMGLLGLDLPVPDHTTFSRRSVNLTVATALNKASGPVTVVIDSTRLKVFGAGEWHLEKHGGKPRRTWRKLHLAIDPDTGETLASALTAADTSLVGPLLDQIDRRAERHRGHRADPTRPAHPGDPGAGPAWLAKGGRIRPPLSRGDRHAVLPDHHWPEPPGPDSARPEGRGDCRLQSPQHHDQSRNARLVQGRLSDTHPGRKPPAT